MAFEEEGFVVVRGPDVLWGGDVRSFHPPAGRFDGVIGGPPCQAFTALAALVRHNGHEPRFGNLIPEYERCVSEAQPQWFLMEEVPGAPIPEVDGYEVHAQLLNNRWLGEEQKRVRRISFGTHDGRQLHVQLAALEAPVEYVAVKSDPHPTRREVRAQIPFAVTARHPGRMSWQPKTAPTVQGGHDATPGNRDKGYSGRYPLEEALRLQGLPADFLKDAPFTMDGKRKAIANGVPLPMGRAIARAVRKAVGE